MSSVTPIAPAPAPAPPPSQSPRAFRQLRRAALLRAFATSQLARDSRGSWVDGDLLEVHREAMDVCDAKLAKKRANCSSYCTLRSAIRRLTCAGKGARSVHRLAEDVALGKHVPYAALTHRALPIARARLLDAYRARVYCGRFIDEAGARFATSCQDRVIRIYDTHGGDARRAWTVLHHVVCDDVRWTVTDFDVSKCGRWLVYVTLNQFVHVVDLHRCDAVADSHARPHHTIAAMRRTTDPELFGIMTCSFTPDAKHVIIGTTGLYGFGTGTIRVLDVERHALCYAVNAHAQDVNSVQFLRKDDPSMLLSASDDGFVKLWDRRSMPNHTCVKQPIARPSSTFVGHVEGLTHVSSKNDGRFLISQGKDQCIKLWDVRKPTKEGTPPSPPKDLSWDYRRESYPGPLAAARKYRDDAVMTYQGSHKTLQTLIRSHFSPIHSTGQKYIYTGSSTGHFAIYDVLSGSVVACQPAHAAAVRDVSWHPTAPLLTTVGWDHNVLLWTTHSEKPFTTVPDTSLS